MSAHGPGTTAPAQQYDADQTQYVPPLQSWAPDAPLMPSQTESNGSFIGALLFLAVGLVVPIVALLTGIWALLNMSDGGLRYFVVAFAGFALFLLPIVGALPG